MPSVCVGTRRSPLSQREPACDGREHGALMLRATARPRWGEANVAWDGRVLVCVCVCLWAGERGAASRACAAKAMD